MLLGSTVVVFLSSNTAGVVEVTPEGTAVTWSVPHARVAIIRQDTPTTRANLDGVIVARFLDPIELPFITFFLFVPSSSS